MDEDLKEIIDAFIFETDELMESAVEDVMTLEERADEEIINRLFRAFHSVKGHSRMLGFDELGALGHKAEDVLSLIREGQLEVDTSLADALLHTVDMMRLILDDIRAGGTDDRDVGGMIRVLDDISSKVEQGGPPEQKGLDDERESGVEIVLIDEKEPEDIVPAHGERQAEPPVMQEKKPSTYHRPKIADSQEGLKKRPVKQLKILIVEDEFSARQILISFLSEYGECHIAKDGIEGINAFVNSYEEDPPQPYNLICMDIKMPQMDGTQATRTIREIERGKGVEGTDQETTIIIASATDDPKTIIKACYECGANYYFVKPLSKKQIVRQMKKLALL